MADFDHGPIERFATAAMAGAAVKVCDLPKPVDLLALVADLRRLRAIEDMARFVLAEHDIANTRPKADGNALGHAHRNPPKWDDRDGVCTWCVSVAALRHALGADRG